MTQIEQPELADFIAPPVSSAARRWQQFEAWLGRQSDRLNPILVKEARQALRSRQFTTTFFLMLAAGWTWSILGLALLGPAAYYNASGPSMFYAYYFILAAPLLVVIPYFAYSSLSAERQDRTHELVSITALDATHILTGKLCGIGLQMLIYLSAIFPCLAFTYLLRGLDIFSVLFCVLYTCLTSLGLAMVGLLLATLVPPRQRSIILSVLFAVFLVYAFGMSLAVYSAMIATEVVLLDAPEFWESNFSSALFYGNAFAITFLAARSRLMSVAQNRSTALRVALVVAQISAIAWCAWTGMKYGDDILYGLIFFSVLAWYFAGVILVGESPELSSRVRRGLPASKLGRLLTAWFTPGSGTGYMLAITKLLTLTVVVTVLPVVVHYVFTRYQSPNAPLPSGGGSTPDELFPVAAIATSYLVIYLGLCRLIFTLVRRVGEVRLTIRILVGVLLLLFGCGAPWVVQITNPATRNLDYTLLQITNPAWTLWEYCVDGTVPVSATLVLLATLPLAAILIWMLNLASLAREFRQAHVVQPARVTIDEAELAAAATPQVATSPWDN